MSTPLPGYERLFGWLLCHMKRMSGPDGTSNDLWLMAKTPIALAIKMNPELVVPDGHSWIYLSERERFLDEFLTENPGAVQVLLQITVRGDDEILEKQVLCFHEPTPKPT